MIGGYELFWTAGTWTLLQCVIYLLLAFRPVPVYESAPAYTAVLVGLLVFLPLLFFVILNGFFRILFTSAHLRLVWRALLLLFWWFPVVNLVLFAVACRKVHSEYRMELARCELDAQRAENEVCKTKYPILLVHGIFFRDWQLVNYWGRIPRELQRNGADLHYGGQQSAAAVKDSAEELRETIFKVMEETGCEKVNIIAHSKGGLDSRYAISRLGMDSCVASLTTINTPHRGCIFAQELLKALPKGLISFITRKYNAIFHSLGDKAPDFMSGVLDLTADRCARLNQEAPDMPGVLYQSVMSTMRGFGSGGFPLDLTWLLVKRYDKEANDGLVALSSAAWGNYLGNRTAPARRGISHGDIIDLMREDIPGFDVREFYVSLVKDLKALGL
ncbi:MAG: triacylglycerol lipase [Clostridia bacterium]|nr:triacylglycerol lipase [Clostridia bacterium]